MVDAHRPPPFECAANCSKQRGSPFGYLPPHDLCNNFATWGVEKPGVNTVHLSGQAITIQRIFFGHYYRSRRNTSRGLIADTKIPGPVPGYISSSPNFCHFACRVTGMWNLCIPAFRAASAHMSSHRRPVYPPHYLKQLPPTRTHLPLLRDSI